jgi:hypothetical protein
MRFILRGEVKTSQSDRFLLVRFRRDMVVRGFVIVS